MRNLASSPAKKLAACLEFRNISANCRLGFPLKIGFMKFKALPSIIIVAALAAASGQAAVIFTDTFDSGTGSWYRATASGSLTNVSNSLRWVEGGSGGGMTEAWGRSFASQTLTVGQTIILSFDFLWNSSIPSGNGQIFRAGLFDVTNPIAAANWSSASGIGAWGGYYSFVRDGDTTGNIARLESAVSANSTTGPTSGSGTTITQIGSNTTSFNLVENTLYSGTFQVTYTSASQLDTLFSLSDGTNNLIVSGSQASGTLITTFDTVVFKAGNDIINVDLDNIKVEVIPEPSAALLGGLGLLALLRRRR